MSIIKTETLSFRDTQILYKDTLRACLLKTGSDPQGPQKAPQTLRGARTDLLLSVTRDTDLRELRSSS